jgi:hypothetical protein
MYSKYAHLTHSKSLQFPECNRHAVFRAVFRAVFQGSILIPFHKSEPDKKLSCSAFNSLSVLPDERRPTHFHDHPLTTHRKKRYL